MKAVLYAHDMEPITVIDIQPWAWQFLREQRSVRVAVHRPLEAWIDPDAMNGPKQCDMSAWIVNITAERFIRNGKETLFLFTHNEEAALLLKSELLPGQHRDVQNREKTAFAKGFMEALNMMGKR